MYKSRKRPGRWTAIAGATAVRYRRLACEWLEDRRMLSLGDLLQTLNNPGPAANGWFGVSVAASGTIVVAGAPYNYVGTTLAGSAFISDIATGSLLHTLNNPTPAVGNGFGYSVAVSGSTVVVGAPNDDIGDTNAGAVYVFDAATGSLLRTLNNPTPAASDMFGYSVAVSGTTVVVGAPDDDTGATGAGAVYLFDAVTGNLLRTLNNPTPAVADYFGYSVSMSESLLVVGAPYDNTGATDAGSAYYYTPTGYLRDTLNNPTPAEDDYFGISVAVSGDTVVVGAYGDDTGATDAGSAYFFDAATGDLSCTRGNPMPAENDAFGTSVSVSGTTVVVGAPDDDTGATDAGAVYLFDAVGSLLGTLANPTPAVNDCFGESVAAWGSRVVAGARHDDTGATDAGAVYLFDSTPGNTSVSLVGNDLIILDDAAGGKDDSLSIRLDTAPTPNQVVIRDPSSTLDAINIPGVAGEGTDTLRVPVDAFSGQVIVATGGADDTLTVDFTGGSPFTTAGLVYHGGLNGPTGDQLEVTGTSELNAIYRPDGTMPGDGSVEVFDNNTCRCITFTGVEPIDVSTMQAVSVETPNGADSVTVAATWGDSVVPGNLLHTLHDPTAATGDYDYFGYSVAVSGSTVVVGASRDDTGASGAGAAYIFDAVTGKLLWTLKNPTPAASDYFGNSVAVSGNTVVVGAYRDDTGATDAGSVYIFDTATGNLVRTLNNPTPAAGDYFGYSVAVAGSTVVVGAPYDDTGATDAGAAHTFDAVTGNLLSTLNNPAPAAGDYFGYSVAVSGSTVVVGASRDDTGATDAGSAYIFNATGTLNHMLNNPTPAESDYFGHSVSVSGSMVVVGAYRDDTGATDAGSAYLFGATTGSLLRTLNNPAPAAYDDFGYSVSVSGNTVVVGAYRDDTGVTVAGGAAYVIDAATGNLLHTLHNPTPAAYDDFGFSVAVSGSTAVVGAYRDETGPTSAGSAYVFGNLVRTLNNPAPAASDYFGRAVAASGSTVVVGAPYDDAGAADAGSVYICDAATGNLVRVLSNPAPAVGDYFGYSVAASGSTVVVGAPYDDAGAADAGSVYVFDAATGNLVRVLNNPAPAASDCFGYSVAVSGSTVVVGAPYDDTGAADAGSVYIFDATTGNLRRTLNNPSPAASDNFGYCVSVSGNTVAVGAYRDDTGATNSGAAYLFDAVTGNLFGTLNNPTPSIGDNFGLSVAVYGSWVVVGAPYDNTGATDAGSACMFSAVTGNLLRTLSNPVRAANVFFGCSVSVSGSTVVVGACGDNTGAVDAGVAHLFDAYTGELLGTLNNPTPAMNDYFGWSVSVSASRVVVGAPNDNTGVTDAGSAYVFDADRVRATTIAGASGGVSLGPLTICDVGELVLELGADLSANRDEVVLSGDRVARGLESIAMHLGTGLDEVELSGDVDLGTYGQFRATGEVVNLTGEGTLHALLSGVDAIEATGALTLGTGGLGGFQFAGTMAVGAQSVTLSAADFARLGALTTIEGGTLAAAHGVFLSGGSTLQGMGTVAGRVAAQVGSTIFATGSLALGDASSFSGFLADGELYVGPYLVTIHDRNQGVLGALTEIGDSLGPGMLSAPHGLLLENDKVLYGYGMVNNAFENQGYVLGEGPLPEDELEFTGLVTGSGDFDGNILFSGGYSPGNSPAEVHFGGNITFGPSATLYIELSGTLAGADYDCLDVAGRAELGGSIVVSLIRGYVPALGDTFQLIDADGGITGNFTDQSLPDLPSDLVWDVDFSSGVATVIDAPPKVDIIDVSPDPRTAAVDTIRIVFSEAITGFDLVDLMLQRNGGGNLLTAAQTLTTSDNVTWELGNLSDATRPLGTYVATLSAASSGITDLSGIPLVDDAKDIWIMHSPVAGRHIFYNRSAFDGNNVGANAADDNAIATDKQALLNGQKATLANYTSYSRGINGIMIDIANLAQPAGLTAADFEFRMGNDNNLALWSLLALDPSLITIAVRPGEGVDGSDRVTIIFPDGAVKKTWLQVTVKATAATGLAVPDVHYWGNAIGDSGDATTNTAVNVVDALGVRANPHTLLKPAPIDDAYDYNRDKQVNVQDELIVRANPTTLLTDLNLIDLSGYGGAGEGEGEGAWSGDAWAIWDGSSFADTSMPMTVTNAVDLSHTTATLLLRGNSRFLPLTDRSSEVEHLAERLPQRSDPQRDTAKLVSSDSPVDDDCPVGLVKEEQSHSLARRANWAQDAHGGQQQHTLDEALEELLAEWEQF